MQWDLRHYCNGISLREDVLRVGGAVSASEALQLLWEMPDDGALMASIRARMEPAEPGAVASKPNPDSWQGRLLARRKERPYDQGTRILAGLFHAMSGKPWPGLPNSNGSKGAVVVTDLADLNQIL